MAGHHNRVYTQVRRGPMASPTAYGPIKLIGRGHVAPFLHPHTPAIHLGQAVERIYLIGHHIAEKAILHHHPCPTRIFFLRRLEYQHHSSAPLIAHGCQDFGCPKQRGSVHIVPTGMHDSWRLRCERKSRQLLDGKGIVIRPQCHAVAVRVVRTFNHGHYTRLAHAHARLKSHLPQSVGHKGHRSPLLLAELRVLVQPSPPAGYLFTSLVRRFFYLFNQILHV